MNGITGEHHLGRKVAHHTWDRDEPPALTVAPGAEVALALRDGSNGQIVPTTDPAELYNLDLSKMDPLTGPIYVEGARVGDAVSVEILEIALGSTGWSAIIPNLGLLSADFAGPYVRTWDTTGRTVDIGGDHEFALRPMLGVVGVAPSAPGKYSSVVPTDAGGNIDVKYVTAGSTIVLPVFNDGALVSMGDAHALQGDGELNGTAIECEADVIVRIGLHRDANLTAPVIHTAPIQLAGAEEPFQIFLGVGPDLFVAAQEAARRAVDGLASALKVEPEIAYALLGTVAELRIHEIVDRPNWVVGCMLPERLFR